MVRSMPRIEEAFNDCFDRLLSGESLESCLSRYPQYAAELYPMLTTAFNIKRMAYPIQPRPEFKYWASVRLQGVQDYLNKYPGETRSGAFQWRRSWVIALASVFIIILATGGTAAASSDALPDQALYGVKLAVEQTQLALTFSEIDKAELHTQFAEKRAQEISALADQGKTDVIIATTTRMNYQLEQAELSLKKYAAEGTGTTGTNASSTGVPAASTSVSETSSAPAMIQPPSMPPSPPTMQNYNVPPTPPTVQTVQPPAPPVKAGTENKSNESQPTGQTTAASGTHVTRTSTNVHQARMLINTNNAKSLVNLQNALDKAPDSAKPALRALIERTKKATEEIQTQNAQSDDSPDTSSDDIVPLNPPVKHFPLDKSKPGNNTD